MPDTTRAILADLTEYRQSLLARPPAIVHGTALLLGALVIAAVIWSAFTYADLVVVAQGRVRPVDAPVDVFASFTGQPGEQVGRRVLEVHYAEGDRVKKGDPLIRFDAENLDYEIEKQQQIADAARQELSRIDELERLLKMQTAGTLQKADAELTRIESEIARAEQQRESAIAKGEAALKVAQDEEARYRSGLTAGAGTETELQRIALRAKEAAEDLAAVKLPIDRSALEVHQRTRELAEQDLAVRSQELALQRLTRQRDLQAAETAAAELGQRRESSLLLAPVDGVVITAEVQPGDVVPLNKPVVQIARQEELVFEGFIPAADVGNLEPGAPVRVKIDAYHYQQYGTLPGRVVFISTDSGVVETGEASQAVIYVVRIALDGQTLRSGKLQGPLKLGMTGRAEIVTEQASLLSLLFRKIRRTISVG